MKNLFFCLVAVSVPVLAQPQPVPMRISDAEAVQKAKQALRDIDDGYKQLVLARRDVSKLTRLANDLVKKTSEWPMDHLAYRALFPYSDCPQALNDLANMARSKADNSAHLLSDATSKFSESLAECQKAVRKPDMGLKNIQ